jgi:hypothetical protein
MFRLLLISIAILVVHPHPADAGTFGDARITHRSTKDTASLKVLDPEGFAITVDTPKLTDSGTAPEVFPLRNHDQFVTVTIKAPDGTTWRRKVEVQANHQTVISISFTKSTPATQNVRRYLGSVHNTIDACTDAFDAPVQFEFLDQKLGKAQATARVGHGKSKQVELPAGTYDVRIQVYEDSAWHVIGTTRDVQIDRDGWRRAFGCHAHNARNPTLFKPR